MPSSDRPRAVWRRSSRSNGGGNGACVEVAELPDRIALRDSKDPGGPELAFPRAAWCAFLSSTRDGWFG